ncbi:T9SS type B sorting domain-containing protein [Ferruginibacter albus]|uniref:T9SS type B sorting domain-containing protein n=1 Tax=Ferruginibacter albus TaxID=2875540 RepID=UPI001CC528C2|nr:gliding motility-associated C-terminal domain-containing protein [Ferruginibacter albus]UAY52777.1 gliding motility-associated C-terminal domain-containing protein [Ferruginibacter albus]
MKYVLAGLLIFFIIQVQGQVCPANVNFSFGDITHWFAYTGNNQHGNGLSAIKQTYDSTVAAPAGTIGATYIPEYTLPQVKGITVNTTNGTDIYGGFDKIPTINGYSYDYSVTIGSTSITRKSRQNDPPPGGYIRGVSYIINVPPGSALVPYTMTYAYAMVLENGTHNSSEQPLFSATLNTPDSIITCASPAYYLPTFNNSTNGGGATLDSATAIENGFSPSRLPSPNPDPNSDNPNAQHLYDVWAKGWTEVTFDLSGYRGKQVALTFEVDNCVPGGHFAYAYVAIRNTCNGLAISGNTNACTGTTIMYSVPALANATYQWTVPPGWTIISGANTNIITVKVGSQSGAVSVREKNSCADLQSIKQVTTSSPTVAGVVGSDNTVCTGNNSTQLTLNGNSGSVLKWIASIDNGANWTSINNTGNSLIAQNLTSTTVYKAVVQNSSACTVDSTNTVTITVDEKSVGGAIDPANSNVCNGQNTNNVLTLTGNLGNVLAWQSSTNGINWTNVNPPDVSSTYSVGNIILSTSYRAIVKNGVCNNDTSAIASVKLFPAAFPAATIQPEEANICYGDSALTHVVITTGTSYSWSPVNSLRNYGNGIVNTTPYVIDVTAFPGQTTGYVLSVQNTGCPNILTDTFLVNVVPPFKVSAGNDTVIVANQPLQLQATTSDLFPNQFTWTPSFYLDNTTIANPIATIGTGIYSMTYMVKGIDAVGCSDSAYIHIKIYDVPADIYVPTAFTPNGDGLNDVFKPIALGIRSLSSFRIYNRWGAIVFSTNNIGKGWDGTFNGEMQNPGNYVWIADGINYSGVPVQKKGNVILIR